MGREPIVAAEKTARERDELLLPEVLRSEVNLLVLPFFALSRKGLGKKMETEFKAKVVRDGKQLEILWQVTANAKYGYPGPFDKKVHKAVEQIIDGLPLPIENPIRLGSLYHIAQLMELSPSKKGSYSGQIYKKIKEALERLVLTGVRSRGTFYSKARKRWIDETFHLYDQIIFKGEELEDGTIADSNYLFLSRWYLENINARYVRPLDYSYYKSLRNLISQRLYELLGVKFYYILQSDADEAYIRYKYSTLCQLLPIRRQRYLSQAKRVLQPAHQELQATGFLERVVWRGIRNKAKVRDWYVYYYPGPRAHAEIRKYRLGGILELAIETDEGAVKSEGKERVRPESREEKDLFEIQALVEDILELTGDEKSRLFYTKVAWRCPSNAIYRILSEVKDDWLRGKVRKSKGALFTDKIKRYAKERGIDLGLKSGS